MSRTLLSLSFSLAVIALGPDICPAREHPYLFFQAADIPELRHRIVEHPVANKAYLDLLRQWDEPPPLTLPPPNAKIREEWEPAVRRIPRNAVDAAFLYTLTDDQRYLAYAREFLLTWATQFDARVNFHNLDQKDGIVIYDTGSLGIFTAWTYDMIYPALSPDERSFIEEKLLRAIVETIRATTEKVSIQDQWAGKTEDTGNRANDYDWASGQWNGTMYCNAGIAAIGFVLQDAELIEHAVGNWKTYLERDLLADGMWQEEDFNYSRFCYSSMQTVAEMAYQYGYETDLYQWTIQARPYSAWDERYVDAPFILPERNDSGVRSMKAFLDAQIDYQYPNFAPGNWGWQTNRASFLGHPTHVTFYELGLQHYEDPTYAWILGKMDRTRGNFYAQGALSPILYGTTSLEIAAPPSTESRWYDHSRWLVLKSIEGPEYWDSDSLYAFMPYGGERTKALKPLSLDLFAFGKVVAPRVAKNSRLQAHDKDYYLTDDAWNAYQVDGTNVSLIRDKIVRSQMRFHDFQPAFKIGQATIEVQRQVRPSIWYDEVAKREPEEDRTDSRLIGMSADYVLDIVDLRFQQSAAYKHLFTWIWHAFGELTLEGVKDGELARGDWTATWLDPDDGIGLRTHMRGNTNAGGTKVAVRRNSFGAYLDVSRGNYEETFVAVHEPFRNQPGIDSIETLAEGDGTIVLKIIDEGHYTDYLCINYLNTSLHVTKDGTSVEISGPYAYLRVTADTIEAQGEIRSFTIRAAGIERLTLNGQAVPLRQSRDGFVHYEAP